MAEKGKEKSGPHRALALGEEAAAPVQTAGSPGRRRPDAVGPSPAEPDVSTVRLGDEAPQAPIDLKTQPGLPPGEAILLPRSPIPVATLQVDPKLLRTILGASSEHFERLRADQQPGFPAVRGGPPPPISESTQPATPRPVAAVVPEPVAAPKPAAGTATDVERVALQSEGAHEVIVGTELAEPAPAPRPLGSTGNWGTAPTGDMHGPESGPVATIDESEVPEPGAALARTLAPEVAPEVERTPGPVAPARSRSALLVGGAAVLIAAVAILFRGGCSG